MATIDPETIEILTMYACGLSTAEVADRLGVPAEDVRRGLVSAMRELGAGSKLEALIAAYRQGLIGV